MNSISRQNPSLAFFSGRGPESVSPSPKVRWTIFLTLALIALAIRLPQLAERPMHTDESVNAYITGELLAGQAFHYDPQDRHGPALFVVGKPLARLLGAKQFSDLTETELRLSTVITGTATVLMFGAGVEMFGFIACLVAALLFAFAPLPVYYSRYFIHETLFVMATLGFILSGWRTMQKKSLLPAALAGFCAALMLACKETAVIHFLAIGIALIACRIWSGWGSITAKTEKRSSLKILSIAAAAFIVTAVVLFTWFGRNWTVFSDLLQAVGRFAARAGGEGHEKPPLYYMKLFGDTPGLIPLAALAACVAGWKFCNGRDVVNGFWLICASVTLLIYSFIPYKTPWLALSIFLPLSMLVGIFTQTVWTTFKFQGRVVLLICAAVFFAAQFQHTSKWCYKFSSDESNPYAYAHTSEDLLLLPKKLEMLIQKNHRTDPRIAVVAVDAWPLPWYLRKFSQVGFWQPGQETGDADYFITSTEMRPGLSERLKTFRPEYFGARPGVLLILWSPDDNSTNR